MSQKRTTPNKGGETADVGAPRPESDKSRRSVPGRVDTIIQTGQKFHASPSPLAPDEPAVQPKPGARPAAPKPKKAAAPKAAPQKDVLKEEMDEAARNCAPAFDDPCPGLADALGRLRTKDPSLSAFPAEMRAAAREFFGTLEDLSLLYENIMRYGPCGISLYRDGKLVACSGAMYGFTGIPPKDQVGLRKEVVMRRRYPRDEEYGQAKASIESLGNVPAYVGIFPLTPEDQNEGRTLTGLRKELSPAEFETLIRDGAVTYRKAFEKRPNDGRRLPAGWKPTIEFRDVTVKLRRENLKYYSQLLDGDLINFAVPANPDDLARLKPFCPQALETSVDPDTAATGIWRTLRDGMALLRSSPAAASAAREILDLEPVLKPAFRAMDVYLCAEHHHPVGVFLPRRLQNDAELVTIRANLTAEACEAMDERLGFQVAAKANPVGVTVSEDALLKAYGDLKAKGVAESASWSMWDGQVAQCDEILQELAVDKRAESAAKKRERLAWEKELSDAETRHDEAVQMRKAAEKGAPRDAWDRQIAEWSAALKRLKSDKRAESAAKRRERIAWETEISDTEKRREQAVQMRNLADKDPRKAVHYLLGNDAERIKKLHEAPDDRRVAELERLIPDEMRQHDAAVLEHARDKMTALCDLAAKAAKAKMEYEEAAKAAKTPGIQDVTEAVHLRDRLRARSEQMIRFVKQAVSTTRSEYGKQADELDATYEALLDIRERITATRVIQWPHSLNQSYVTAANVKLEHLQSAAMKFGDASVQVYGGKSLAFVVESTKILTELQQGVMRASKTARTDVRRLPEALAWLEEQRAMFHDSTHHGRFEHLARPFSDMIALTKAVIADPRPETTNYLSHRLDLLGRAGIWYRKIQFVTKEGQVWEFTTFSWCGGTIRLAQLLTQQAAAFSDELEMVEEVDGAPVRASLATAEYQDGLLTETFTDTIPKTESVLPQAPEPAGQAIVSRNKIPLPGLERK